MTTLQQSMVPADSPVRAHLVYLQTEIEKRRDELVRLDEAIAELAEKLAEFEASYHARLAGQNLDAKRLTGLIRHLERWCHLLRKAPRDDVDSKVARVEARRKTEAEALMKERIARQKQRQADKEEEEKKEHEWEEIFDDESSKAIKAVYRRLVRMCHPDTARTEQERVRFGRLLHRITELRKMGELGRLQMMEEQLGRNDLDLDLLRDFGPEQQVAMLQDRLVWLDAVLENLREELAELENSDAGRLWKQNQLALEQSRDFFEELREELDQRLHRMTIDVGWAIQRLEEAVHDYNKQVASGSVKLRRQRSSAAIEKLDPFSSKALVRMGVEALSTMGKSPEARRQAEWVEGLASKAPHELYLLLLAHVTQLSPLPLLGIESFTDLKLRFETLTSSLAEPQCLEQSLAALSDMVEFGVRSSTWQRVHLGLRFRSEPTAEAMFLSVQAAPVRAAFKEVLSVLGEASDCPSCSRFVFTIPVYRIRGLDNLSATVCPACGETIRRYYMVKGDDVQSVLNQTYLDYDLISEWTFRLGRASVALQLLPVEVSKMTVGDLKRRFVDELFARYELEVTRGQVRLYQGGKRVLEKVPLEQLVDQKLMIRFDSKAPMNESDAVELLRHRIRNRFG